MFVCLEAPNERERAEQAFECKNGYPKCIEMTGNISWHADHRTARNVYDRRYGYQRTILTCLLQGNLVGYLPMIRDCTVYIIYDELTRQATQDEIMSAKILLSREYSA